MWGVFSFVMMLVMVSNFKVMETANILSIAALGISAISFAWQFYTDYDNKKAKLKIFNHYEIIQAEKKKDDVINVVFTIMNHSSKKGLINAMWLEYIVDELTPKPLGDVNSKESIRDREFPVQIAPNDVYILKPSVSWNITEYTIIDIKSKSLNEMIQPASRLNKVCRLVIKDMKGNVSKSDWVNVNLSQKDIAQRNDTVIIEYNYNGLENLPNVI